MPSSSEGAESGNGAESGEGLGSISLRLARTMLLCCCWPVHKCVSMLSFLDTIIAFYFAYKTTNSLMDTMSEPHWLTVFAALFFGFFFVCQLLATVFIVLAHKQENPRYCYPRLALLSGLVICSAIATGIILMYFMGGAKSMNNFFFSLYEWFFSEILDEKEKIELKGELKLYALLFLALAFFFTLYSVFEWLLTRKFYQSLRQFTPVPQNEPSAPPPPAFNPQYSVPPTKMYPNLA